jgi:predicted transposase/invertase (TIGR01784 family)
LGRAKNALETAHLDGLAEGKIDVAKKMLAGGFDAATIATMTDLTVQQIEALN